VVEDVLDPGRAEQEGAVGRAAADAFDGVRRVGRVADALAAEPVDQLRVELTRLAADEVCRVGTHEHGGRAVEGLRGECRERLVRRGERVAVEPDLRPTLEHAVRRQNREPRILRRHEHREQPVAPALLREGDGGLVAMVAVRDQKLRARERLRHPLVAVESPQARPGRLEIGRACGDGERRRAVVEEEERLELGLRRSQEPETSAPCPFVRPLVR
jgi:hypothetical protein